MNRRAWRVGLCLYALAAAADATTHLAERQRAGGNWLAAGSLAVAFSGGLFWPIDLVARRLLAR